LTFKKIVFYNEYERAGWRGILLSPASFSFSNLGAFPASSFYKQILIPRRIFSWEGMQKKYLCYSLALFSLAFCAPARIEKALPGPAAAEAEAKVREAEQLLRRGCYAAFQRSLTTYGALYAEPSLRRNVAPHYLRALLLTALREKELDIFNPGLFQAAKELIKENSSLIPFEPYLELIAFMGSRKMGVVGDVDAAIAGRIPVIVSDESTKTLEELRPKAMGDAFYVYLYISLCQSYSYKFKEGPDLEAVLEPFPDSVLARYINGLYFQAGEQLFKELLQADPEFFEAFYFQGEMALGKGNLLEAETNFLKALEGIPGLSQAAINLGGIYFAIEEFERSIEYFDKTLEIVPSYRDAILGKAISLSYLGRNAGAIALLETLVAMGHYLMGESHYWLAWNQHELKDNVSAQANIDQAKGRLPTNSEVFSLSGTIAYERGELDRAQKDFEEALVYSANNTEALYNLGRIFGDKQQWEDSGTYFEIAARAFEHKEAALEQKMAEIKGSSLSQERKARLLLKKESQLKILQLTRATSYYNAAAGFHNAGQKEKALTAAEKACFHPNLKEKAQELIAQIKSK
jgi:tetratricopeptide (TPR) repeat protein